MFSLWAFPSWETLATFFSRKVAWGSSIMIISNVEGPFSESSFNRLTPLKINSWNLRHYQLKMNIISTIHLHFWGSTGCKSSGKNGVCLAFEFPPPRYEKKPLRLILGRFAPWWKAPQWWCKPSIPISKRISRRSGCVDEYWDDF